MLRWQTAGESHGEALVAMIEGMPAGVRVTSQDIVGALARRRLGYGRGARMKFEQDQVRLLTGVRHGETLGSPIAIEMLSTTSPCQIGDGSRTRIRIAATSANLASTLYSLRMKVFAPSLISVDTSWIVLFVVFCFFTQR